jgi:hypothetical protein
MRVVGLAVGKWALAGDELPQGIGSLESSGAPGFVGARETGEFEKEVPSPDGGSIEQGKGGLVGVGRGECGTCQ